MGMTATEKAIRNGLSKLAGVDAQTCPLFFGTRYGTNGRVQGWWVEWPRDSSPSYMGQNWAQALGFCNSVYWDDTSGRFCTKLPR